MQFGVIDVLDPELVIPSHANLANEDFWARFFDWVENPVVKMGPSTLEGFLAVTAEFPGVLGISRSDLWRFCSRFVSQTFDESANLKDICHDHIEVNYASVFGAKDNADRLKSDLMAAGESSEVIVHSCIGGASQPQEDCEDCSVSGVLILNYDGSDSKGRTLRLPAYRALFMERFNGDLQVLRAFADDLFPRLAFSDVAWRDAKRLDGDRKERVFGLVKHLTVLNDHASSIWADNTSVNDKKKALASHGVVASPESPSTHGNPSVIKDRMFRFNNRSKLVKCEWHTKLHATVNRVHFSVKSDVVLIGTITDHLPT